MNFSARIAVSCPENRNYLAGTFSMISLSGGDTNFIRRAVSGGMSVGTYKVIHFENHIKYKKFQTLTFRTFKF